MATLYDAPPEVLVDALAERLADRDEFEEPEWVTYAKTGEGRELPPEQEDFWARRCASLLRKIAIDGPVGVGALKREYGSTKRGSNRYKVSPNRKSEGSGSVIRTAVQQLEDADLVETEGTAGRIVTGAGRSLLDETAGDVLDDLDRPELERYA